ncbi:uncharacterized protein [Triticum aestivum]|nr:uncharacterized protein LOC123158833 [Triticum aestivum]XP_044432600.1 uncharacterized protein LOC123158835 [Triticum aestivum]
MIRRAVAVAATSKSSTSQLSETLPPAGIDNEYGGLTKAAEADNDGTRTVQTAGAVAVAATTTTTPVDRHGVSTSQPSETPAPAAIDGDDGASPILALLRRRAHDLDNWFSNKKKLRRRQRLNDNGGGVKVQAHGIGNMAALRTLGVVNVSGAGGKAILKEVNKLTQLRKLGVSGINRKNWHDLYSAISGHGHLESLSVYFDKGEPATSFFSRSSDMFSGLPKSLKSLKLYSTGGEVQVPPVLVKHLYCLRKSRFDLIVSTQEDIYSITEFPHRRAFRNIYVKPVQDGQLHYGQRDETLYCDGFTDAPILKIDCGSYKLAICFGYWIPEYIEVLVVDCSTAEASLEVSGLKELSRLKEVWLKGSYSEAIKQHLQQKLDELHSSRLEEAVKYGRESRYTRAVLRLEDQAHPS